MAGGFGTPPKRPGVGSPSWGLGGVAMPSRRAWKSRETLPVSREGLGRSGEVGRPARRTRSGQDALQKGTGGGGRSSQRVSRAREGHLESQEGSIGKEEYGRPTWRAGNGREALTEGWEG